MKSLPSVSTISRIAGDRAKELRSVLELRGDAVYDAVERYPAVRHWVSQCYNLPRCHELKMAIANEILGTYGVEYIPKGHNSRSPSIEYCNTGETYDLTLLFVRGRYVVGNWGDIVERGNYD